MSKTKMTCQKCNHTVEHYPSLWHETMAKKLTEKYTGKEYICQNCMDDFAEKGFYTWFEKWKKRRKKNDKDNKTRIY
jgi:hypothetical protein